MKTESMAQLIAGLRKGKNMTQKQLADKLHVTDKAVSKWERGMGYPDIGVLSLLADALDVTVNELLDGKKGETPNKEQEQLVENTLRYVQKVHTDKKETAKQVAKAAVTLAFLTGIVVCLICDFAIAGTMTWSWFPVVSTVFVWLVAMPALHMKKRGVLFSLIALSVLVFPFILALNALIGTDILTVGIPCALIGIVYLWVVYTVFALKRANAWAAGGICVLSAIPATATCNALIAHLLDAPRIDIWDVLSYAILLLAAAVLFILGRGVNGRRA